MRLDEEITAGEYAEAKKRLVDRQIELKEKTEDREKTSANWLELAENFFETAFQAREVLEGNNPEQKRNLVRAIGWNLILKDKNLGFSFKRPFDILLQPAIRSDMQALVYNLRTLWHKLNSFDIGKIQQCLNPRFAPNIQLQSVL